VDFDTNVEKQHYVWNKTVGLTDKEKVRAIGRIEHAEGN